jgi:threonine synthase
VSDSTPIVSLGEGGTPLIFDDALAIVRKLGEHGNFAIVNSINPAAQRWLATNEGIFVEPASAAPIVGLMKCCDPARSPAYSFAQIPEGSRVVCTVTGHGLKDPDVVEERSTALKTVAATEQAVLHAIDRVDSHVT